MADRRQGPVLERAQRSCSARGRAVFVALFVGLTLSSALSYAEAPDEEKPSGSAEAEVEEIRHVVKEGETLGSIALHHKVSVRSLMHWNKLKGLQIDDGRELVVMSSKPVPPVEEVETKRRRRRRRVRYHKIRRGDTFARIAKKYKVDLRKLRRWNRRVHPRRLQLGQKIKVVGGRGRLARPKSGEGSYGAAARGYLFNGVALLSGFGLISRNPARSFGTKRVVRMLEAAAADLKARWPDAADLVVGDLSFKRGGYMSPHRSHQSGRDADISYYHRGNVQTASFLRMDEEIFDAVKNWHYFKTLIDTGQVRYIFVDYRLQKVLYEYALSIGYAAEDLSQVMQYPRGRGSNSGVIRHVKGHDDHFHIRFKCGPRDARCR